MSEVEIVTLHESNAGHLFIVQSGGRMAYDVTEAAEPDGFEFDAVALLDGDTGDWTVPTLPAEEIANVPVVAEYDGTAGEVRLLADRVGGTTPGHAARRYIEPRGYMDRDRRIGRGLAQTMPPYLLRPRVTLYPHSGATARPRQWTWRSRARSWPQASCSITRCWTTS
jgi:hypothetical protein